MNWAFQQFPIRLLVQTQSERAIDIHSTAAASIALSHLSGKAQRLTLDALAIELWHHHGTRGSGIPSGMNALAKQPGYSFTRVRENLKELVGEMPLVFPIRIPLDSGGHELTYFRRPLIQQFGKMFAFHWADLISIHTEKTAVPRIKRR